MTLPGEIDPLLEPIAALQRLLEQFGGRGVIIGGVAVGFLGRPRMTAKEWVKAFSEALDMPAIWDDLKKLIK